MEGGVGQGRCGTAVTDGAGHGRRGRGGDVNLKITLSRKINVIT